MACTRGTDLSRAHIGMDLFGPAPDFAGLARSMGWWAEGPFENADDQRSWAGSGVPRAFVKASGR